MRASTLFILLLCFSTTNLKSQYVFIKELDFPDLNDLGGEGIVTKGGNFIFKQEIRYSDSSIIRLVKIDQEGNTLKEKSISNISAKYIIQHDGTIFFINDSSFIVSHTYEYDSSSYITTIDTNLNVLKRDTLFLGDRDCIPYRIVSFNADSIKLVASCFVNSTNHFEIIKYDLLADQMLIIDTAGDYNTRNSIKYTSQIGNKIYGAYNIGSPSNRTGYFKYEITNNHLSEYVETKQGESIPIIGAKNGELYSSRSTPGTQLSIILAQLDTLDLSSTRSRSFVFDRPPFTRDIEIFEDRISVLVNLPDSFLRPHPYLFTCNKSNFDSLALVPLFPSDSIYGQLWTMQYDQKGEAFYFTGFINNPLERTVVVRTDKFGCVQEMCLSKDESQSSNLQKSSYVSCEELKAQRENVTVLDLKGNVIYSGQSNGFSCAEQSPGIYFVCSDNETQRLWISDY